jgi:hypothetical protein
MEMCEQIGNVTAEDIMKVCHQIFGSQAHTPVSLVVQGPVSFDLTDADFASLGVGKIYNVHD